MNRRAPPSTPQAPRGSGHVRIIGGRWRGSKLPVADVDGLRPTADRVRETLFNWLQSELGGARVLDLFAGSGALGLEAASRGASRVDLVEASPLAAAFLRETAARLMRGDGARAGNGAPAGHSNVSVHEATAATFLADAAAHGQVFDLVFIDPPFAAGLWNPTLAALVPCLAPRAWVYVESPPGTVVALPARWRLHRELSTRDSRAALFVVDGNRGDAA